MGELRPAWIGQPHLEMTGVSMSEVSKETGAALDLLQDLIGRARRAGADAADAVLFDGVSLSHARRLGKTEKLERSEGHDLGLRVFIGRQQAIVSSTDRSPEALAALVERAVAMARTVPEDPYCGIADPAEIAGEWPVLDMLDPEEPSCGDADRSGARRRGCGTRRHGCHQFRRCGGRLGPLQHRACRVERLCRRLRGLQPRRQRQRDRWLGHRDGARL